eukprot:COSAG01_NODE_47050_length_394_cov_0.864407_1_plen_38_part_10
MHAPATALQNGNSHFGAELARLLLRRLQIFAAGCLTGS